MKVGQLIRMERRKKEIKQEVLARGICSPSYLSKIENSLVTPGDDTQKLLLRRLNIKLDQIGSTTGASEVFSQFINRFKDVINHRDKDEAAILCNEIRSFLEDNQLYEYKINLLLMKYRAMLMMEESIDHVKNNISLLGEMKREMTHTQLFYFHLIEGIIAYLEKCFQEASQFFMLAFSIKENSLIEDWEIAELHYVAGVASLAEYHYVTAMNHAKEAHDYFQNEMLVMRIVECLFILSISQKRFGNVKEALSTFKTIKRLLANGENTVYSGKVEHNIGACYSLLKDSEKALMHFFRSLDLKNNPNDKAVTILAIVKEYNKIEQIEKAQIWLMNAFDLLDSLSEENRKIYSNHFEIYKALLFKESNFSQLFKKILQNFAENKDYTHCAIYCNVFAEKLMEDGQFRLSTIYYKKSLEYYLMFKKVNSWEELT